MKTIRFKSNRPLEHWTEFVPQEEDLLKEAPAILQTERDGFAKMTLAPFYCMFTLKGEKKPRFYYRHSNPDSCRFVGITVPGDTPFDHQTEGYTNELSCPKKGDGYLPYRKTSDEPVEYSLESADGDMKIDFGLDHARIHEGEILNGEIEYFDHVNVDHQNVWPGASTIYQAGIIRGTFMGEPFEGMARFGKTYNASNNMEKGFQFDFGNFNNEYAGVREDGRREEAVIDITFDGGVWAYYWLEGEDPVSSDEVEVTTEFYRLPYLEDQTCMYKDIVFRFAGKEIHFEGQYGLKGYTAEPRFDKPGQAELLGRWYEGKHPYTHKLTMTFNEIQKSFPDEIEKLGFEVLDLPTV